MVIARIKPIEEILGFISGKKSVLVVGCAGCTAVCLAGGQREVDSLIVDLKDNKGVIFDGYTMERQCEMEFVAELDHLIDGFQAVLSMACGAGVQFVAERFPGMPVFPALDTVFVGANREVGQYQENCRCCGDCQLAYTGGICPVALCAKGIYNGPCGGSRNGKCEVDEKTACAWCQIYERLKDQGRLDQIMNIKKPMKWKNQTQGTLVQRGYEKFQQD
ncbi:MAG: methylenetetrahydrofolate reductase C-terminal domain-containing protein [Spirochaetes bacterium]|jgi:hypothetical protein|nr:methylenetetrahydrofolate reductase C-terminal domain-containing protein [Spirochaetota bacterium]